MRPEVLRMPVRILSKINKMTSYQQRKTEIRELKERILMLESLLSEHGIYLGQLTINDNKNMSIPKPPLPPPPRKIKEGINFEKAFSKFWKCLKYWLGPSEPCEYAMIEHSKNMSFLDEKAMGKFMEEKAKACEVDQIRRTKDLVYVLTKAAMSAERLGKSLNRLRRRKKRYSISTPIVRAWK